MFERQVLDNKSGLSSARARRSWNQNVVVNETYAECLGLVVISCPLRYASNKIFAHCYGKNVLKHFAVDLDIHAYIWKEWILEAQKKIRGKADPGRIPDWRPSQAEKILAMQNCCHLICDRWLSTMQFMSDADISQIATSLYMEATARGKRWKNNMAAHSVRGSIFLNEVTRYTVRTEYAVSNLNISNVSPAESDAASP